MENLRDRKRLNLDNPDDVDWLYDWAKLAQKELAELREKVSRVELPDEPANGGQTRNKPIDDTFIYKIVLQDTVIDEQKEKRFVLARSFDDATQLASEMCEGNDWCVIRIKEIGYLDYCTGVIVKYFSRLSVEQVIE